MRVPSTILRSLKVSRRRFPDPFDEGPFDLPKLRRLVVPVKNFGSATIAVCGVASPPKSSDDGTSHFNEHLPSRQF